MKSRKLLKILSIICVCTIVAAPTNFVTLANDGESTTAPSGQESTVTVEEAQKNLEQQRAELEKKLSENEAKLETFEESAKTTAEYIDTLDQKIGYLNEELTLLDSEIAQAQSNIDQLKPEISSLKKELKDLGEEYEQTQTELSCLEEDFQDTYDAYCTRMRAIYVSGNESIIAALLTSSDISEFYNRYQMIKAVSKSDTQLLKQVNAKMEEIVNKQDGLNAQKEVLNAKKTELDAKQEKYKADQDYVAKKQREAADKKIVLSEKRAESDALLAKYSEQTQMYTEYRNEDQELIDAVDKEVENLINGLISPDEIGEFKESEKKNNASGIDYGDGSSLYSNSNAVLNLGYPAPGHYSVSADYGYYSNGKPHTGIDFPCPTGSKIVAAQKGIVITVKRLNYSYGYYVMVYHGTDASGRKIVTLYAHNSSILVSVGQTVKKGQQIAKSGSTGNSTGPHCHFEVIIGGSKVNPRYYLS